MDGHALKAAIQPLVSRLSEEMWASPCNMITCKDILLNLKHLLARLPTHEALSFNSIELELLVCARDVHEMGVQLAIRNRDLAAFERHLSQLFVFYHDYLKILPESSNRVCILGLHLLHLLASNRIGDFHMVLQLIPQNDRESPYIQFTTNLEKDLMDGNYNRVLLAKNHIPTPFYSFFMEIMIDTMRMTVAECIESSFKSLSLKSAHARLPLKEGESLQEFIDIMNSRKEDLTSIKWVIQNDQIQFLRLKESSPYIPSHDMIRNIIGLATELERII